MNKNLTLLYHFPFQAGQEKGNSDLLLWIKDIVNHFWYCSQHCNGSKKAFIVSLISATLWSASVPLLLVISLQFTRLYLVSVCLFRLDGEESSSTLPTNMSGCVVMMEDQEGVSMMK